MASVNSQRSPQSLTLSGATQWDLYFQDILRHLSSPKLSPVLLEYGAEHRLRGCFSSGEDSGKRDCVPQGGIGLQRAGKQHRLWTLRGTEGIL